MKRSPINMSIEEAKTSRSLLRVINITEEFVEFLVPGWDSEKTIKYPNYKAPIFFGVGDYFIAHVNLSAKTEEELILSIQNLTQYPTDHDTLLPDPSLIEKAKERYKPGTGPWGKEEEWDDIDIAYIQNITFFYSVYSDERGIMCAIIDRLLEQLKQKGSNK